MDGHKDIPASDLEEGDEVYNGFRYLVVEDVRPNGSNIRIEADGRSWELKPDRMLRVATY